jgi:dCTP deaminase
MFTADSHAERQPRTPRSIELDRLSKYPDIPDHAQPQVGGVLLSNVVEEYARRWLMIDPFDPKKLKPAGYELCVGKLVSKGGCTSELTDGSVITIEPFEVAIIQTLETLNLPKFLIARWNVRTRWAYQGLLWVGAAQVDAGFRGYLSFPLYNLSDKPVKVRFGEQIAVIDFVTTTPPAKNSIRYEWKNRSRVTFSEYEPDSLVSAIVTRVEKELGAVKASVQGAGRRIDNVQQETRTVIRTETSTLQSRIDNFSSATFTVIAVLFAALALAAAKSIESSFWSSTTWLAAIALWFAMRAFVLTKSRLQFLSQQTEDALKWDFTRVPLWFEVGAAAVLALALLGSNFLESRMTSDSLKQLHMQSDEDHKKIEDLEKTLGASTTQLEQLKAENERLQSRIDSMPTVEKVPNGRTIH